MKTVYSVNLFPRQPVPLQAHPGRDVWEIVQLAVLAGLVSVIAWLVLAE